MFTAYYILKCKTGCAYVLQYTGRPALLQLVAEAAAGGLSTIWEGLEC